MANIQTSTKNKFFFTLIAAMALGLGGCSSTLYKPEIHEASPQKDGVFFVDLRNKPWEISDSAVKSAVAKLLKENCAMEVNSSHPVCLSPADYHIYNGQLRNGMWGKGPVFMATFIPKSLQAKSVSAGKEADGDIVRAKLIPGPVSMLSFDGVIERADDPNRACKWEGTHNYSGGVVCQKYGYNYKELDVSKL